MIEGVSERMDATVSEIVVMEGERERVLRILIHIQPLEFSES